MTNWFQSTRPRGRTRQAEHTSSAYKSRFNPRVLAGGRDLVDQVLRQIFPCFNPRVLAGGRDWKILRNYSVHVVSIHASSREDATTMWPVYWLSLSFNPRVLAGGRDLERAEANKLKYVSIHASSREDATRLSKPEQRRAVCFNPRVLAGGRDFDLFHANCGDCVSIHASSREDATYNRFFEFVQGSFQSTRPRGRTRRTKHTHDTPHNCFNPRVLAGGRDRLVNLPVSSSNVSIHASSREDAT